MGSKFLLQFHWFLFGIRAFSNRKEKKTNESKRTTVTQYLGLTLGSFLTGLASAAVTGVTRPWVMQLVNIVRATVLYLNEERAYTTVSIPANADFSFDLTISHSRMIIT